MLTTTWTTPVGPSTTPLKTKKKKKLISTTNLYGGTAHSFGITLLLTTNLHGGTTFLLPIYTRPQINTLFGHPSSITHLHGGTTNTLLWTSPYSHYQTPRGHTYTFTLFFFWTPLIPIPISTGALKYTPLDTPYSFKYQSPRGPQKYHPLDTPYQHYQSTRGHTFTHFAHPIFTEAHIHHSSTHTLTPFLHTQL